MYEEFWYFNLTFLEIEGLKFLEIKFSKLEINCKEILREEFFFKIII